MTIVSANIEDSLAYELERFCKASGLTMSAVIKGLLAEKLHNEPSIVTIQRDISEKFRETTRQFQGLVKILLLNMEQETITQNFLLTFVTGYIREKKGPMSEERSKALELLEEKMKQNMEGIDELDKLMAKMAMQEDSK